MKFLSILLALTLTPMVLAMNSNDFEQNMRIGKTLKAHRFQDIYFSGQLRLSELEELQEQGFRGIVNIRMPFEHDEALEKKLAKEQGMQYINLPFNMGDHLTEDYFTPITEAITEFRTDGKVLLHCASGNRVGIWVGAYFYHHHNYSKEEAIQVALKMGITKQSTLNKLKEYLNRN